MRFTFDYNFFLLAIHYKLVCCNLNNQCFFCGLALILFSIKFSQSSNYLIIATIQSTSVKCTYMWYIFCKIPFDKCVYGNAHISNEFLV